MVFTSLKSEDASVNSDISISAVTESLETVAVGTGDDADKDADKDKKDKDAEDDEDTEVPF